MDALDLYRRVYEELMAVPVVPGFKTEAEKVRLNNSSEFAKDEALELTLWLFDSLLVGTARQRSKLTWLVRDAPFRAQLLTI